MYFKITFIKVFIAVVLFLLPSTIWASGASPDDPLLLRVGEGPIEITIENAGDIIWVRAEFGDPVAVSNVVFETIGQYDTYMYFYKDLEDAQADKYLEYDDDSGEGNNAKISYSMGYPSPYYLKLKMYSSSNVGTFNLDSEVYYEDPEDCPTAGPCAIQVASKDRPNAREILFTMRNIKNSLLITNDLGRDAIELYYAISKDIIWDLITDLQFSRRLYSLGIGLMPMMHEILRVSLNEEDGIVLSNDMVAKITELKDMMKKKVSEENAERLEGSFESLNLVQNIANPIKSVLLQAGYILSNQSSSLTLDRNLRYLAAKFDIIVKFRQAPPMTPQVKTDRFMTGVSSVDKIFSGYSVESVHQIFSSIRKKDSKIGLERIFKIRLKEDINIDLIIQELLKCPEVEYAEKNKICQALSDDVYFPLQYALENLVYPEADIRAVEAWELETGDPSVLVSVVDTGIDYYHADLKDQVRVDLGYDYVNEDSDPLDDCGHGTHVAGIIGGTYNNLYSIAGVAPNISIVPFKVLDEDGRGTWDDVASGIIASVDAGVRVINLSLGGDSSDVIEDALRYADENGCLVVAAAGNDGTNELIYPASSEYTISVGATDNENLRAYFSSYGEGLDIMAPGEDILSIYVDGLTCYASGTSMATPHVAGVAALVISNLGSPSLQEIKNSLFKTALDLGEAGYDTDYGWGLLDAYSSLFYQEIYYVTSSGSCGGKTPCYSTIQAAIDVASSGATIKIVEGIYSENMTLSSPKELFLSAGWDSAFTSQSTTSTVKSMTISDGTIIVDNLVIQ